MSDDPDSGARLGAACPGANGLTMGFGSEQQPPAHMIWRRDSKARQVARAANGSGL